MKSEAGAAPDYISTLTRLVTSPHTRPVECGGLPAAEAGLPPLSPAKSQVEARDFSPAKNDRREAPSALPKAVAKGEGPEQPIGPRHEASPPQQQDFAAAAPCASASDCSAQTSNAPAAEIPSADLKPLFDYVQNCRACQAQLAAAQKNSADDAAKISALTRERDAAITASKGGSFLRQLRRNAIWFAIGAAGGYIAARH